MAWGVLCLSYFHESRVLNGRRGFSIHILILASESCHSCSQLSPTLASFQESKSYSLRVCFPGSAESTFLEYFNTPSGNFSVLRRSAFVILSVVDLA